MDVNDDQTLAAEMSNRLDSLFKDDDAPVAHQTGLPSDREPENSRRLLQAVKADILSIDWEITDTTVAALIEQLTSLKQALGADKIALILIQMLISLSKYIKARKSKAHVRSMNVMKSVFSGLEKIIGQPTLPQATKMEILRTHMGRFHDFQTQVMPAAAARRRPEVPAAPLHTAERVSPELLRNLTEELKAVIHDEFKRLREEIRAWRNLHDGYATG